VPHSNTHHTCSNQLQASYTDVSHWEELINFNETNCCLKEPYCLTAIDKCNLTPEELNEQYMGLYAAGQMMNNPLYGQISFNSSLSNAFKLKLGHNLKLFLVEMKAVTRMHIAQQVMRPAKVIPTSHGMVSNTPLLISIFGLRRHSMKMKAWWIRRQVGKRLLVSM